MTIKNGDFVEIEFTGKIIDSGKIFDTTNAEIALENKVFQQGRPYKPVTIVVGERHLVPGLDKALVGKQPGKFTILVSPEEGFGKKSSELLKIVPTKEFKKQKINPFVGLEVNVDGIPGIIRTLSGGRVIVDFNHPLSGKDLEYDIEVKRIITNKEEKVKAFLELMQIPYSDIVANDGVTKIITSAKFPENIQKNVFDEVKRLTGMKIVFEEKKKDKK